MERGSSAQHGRRVAGDFARRCAPPILVRQVGGVIYCFAKCRSGSDQFICHRRCARWPGDTMASVGAPSGVGSAPHRRAGGSSGAGGSAGAGTGARIPHDGSHGSGSGSGSGSGGCSSSASDCARDAVLRALTGELEADIRGVPVPRPVPRLAIPHAPHGGAGTTPYAPPQPPPTTDAATAAAAAAAAAAGVARLAVPRCVLANSVMVRVACGGVTASRRGRGGGCGAGGGCAHYALTMPHPLRSRTAARKPPLCRSNTRVPAHSTSTGAVVVPQVMTRVAKAIQSPKALFCRRTVWQLGP